MSQLLVSRPSETVIESSKEAIFARQFSLIACDHRFKNGAYGEREHDQDSGDRESTPRCLWQTVHGSDTRRDRRKQIRSHGGQHDRAAEVWKRWLIHLTPSQSLSD